MERNCILRAAFRICTRKRIARRIFTQAPFPRSLEYSFPAFGNTLLVKFEKISNAGHLQTVTEYPGAVLLVHAKFQRRCCLLVIKLNCADRSSRAKKNYESQQHRCRTQ